MSDLSKNHFASVIGKSEVWGFVRSPRKSLGKNTGCFDQSVAEGPARHRLFSLTPGELTGNASGQCEGTRLDRPVESRCQPVYLSVPHSTSPEVVPKGLGSGLEDWVYRSI